MKDLYEGKIKGNPLENKLMFAAIEKIARRGAIEKHGRFSVVASNSVETENGVVDVKFDNTLLDNVGNVAEGQICGRALFKTRDLSVNFLKVCKGGELKVSIKTDSFAISKVRSQSEYLLRGRDDLNEDERKYLQLYDGLIRAERESDRISQDKNTGTKEVSGRTVISGIRDTIGAALTAAAVNLGMMGEVGEKRKPVIVDTERVMDID